jgi:23S rRNA pseudouridine2605 synthase
VIELAPGDGRLFPVGRLDKDTSGLLLLTDDGDWSNLVTHPRYGVVKEYRALVRGRPSPAALERMRRGVPLPDGTLTAPASVEHIGEDGGDSWLSIAVIEGKKRQIRLMAREVGHPVVALQRVRIGPITLDMLPEGSWRELTAEEVEALRDVARRGFDRGRTPTGRTG